MFGVRKKRNLLRRWVFPVTLLGLGLLGTPAPPAVAADSEQGSESANQLLDQLKAIPGLTVEEQDTRMEALGYRRFSLRFTQPVDHDNPEAGTFQQKVLLFHKIEDDAPMVLNTLGYSLFDFDSIKPLTYQLQGHSLSVEHRFFGESVPEGADYQYLTIKQAAADHNRIIQALKPLYQNPWISTGASKGGMTSLYLRRFYPKAVDGTVAFVAPNSFGRADLRYAVFLDRVGTEQCRSMLRKFQQRLLLDQSYFMSRMRTHAQENTKQTFDIAPGGLIQAFQYAVAESYFYFWQYQTIDDCARVPGPQASDDEVFEFFLSLRSWTVLADSDYEGFKPYYIQAVRELGYPSLNLGHLMWLLSENPNDYGPYLNGVRKGKFNWSSMAEAFLSTAFLARNTMLIYGENDPWTAGSFQFVAPEGRDVHRFMVPQGNHSVQIHSLEGQDKATAIQALERWSGSTFRELPKRDPKRAEYGASKSLYPDIDFPIEETDERFYEPRANRSMGMFQP